MIEVEFPHVPSPLSGEVIRQSVNFHSGNIKVMHRIKAAESGETSAIFIADFLVITSYAKSNVAKNSLNGKLVESLPVENYRRDITQVAAVISIYSKHKFLFVDIAGMRLLRTLDLPCITVSGICCLEGNTFVVTCGSTMTLVNSSGKKLKQNTTAGCSFYVSTSDMKDCTYGDGINSVSRVVGETNKFTYTNAKLNSPRGIGIDFEGNIYIAGLSSKNIHQITNDGKLIRVIPFEIFELQSPWTTRFAPNSNTLVVTCGSSGEVVMCEID